VNPAFFDEVQMGPKTPVPEQDFFRHPLREQINLKHPPVRLPAILLARVARLSPALKGLILV
jgi:IS5 family transposase